MDIFTIDVFKFKYIGFLSIEFKRSFLNQVRYLSLTLFFIFIMFAFGRFISRSFGFNSQRCCFCCCCNLGFSILPLLFLFACFLFRFVVVTEICSANPAAEEGHTQIESHDLSIQPEILLWMNCQVILKTSLSFKEDNLNNCKHHKFKQEKESHYFTAR